MLFKSLPWTILAGFAGLRSQTQISTGCFCLVSGRWMPMPREQPAPRYPYWWAGAEADWNWMFYEVLGLDPSVGSTPDMELV